MTNRTMDSGSSRMGGDEANLDIDDLFASSSDGGREDEPTDESTTPEGTDGRDEIEDTTAGELFQQLSAEVEAEDDETEADPFDELSDESPEEIIASADEEVEHVDEVDDAIAADDELFDTLLLPEREEEDGFLWVQTEDDDEATTRDDPDVADETTAADEPPAATDDTESASPAAGSTEGDLDEDGFSFDVDDDTASSAAPAWGTESQAAAEEAGESAAEPAGAETDDGETPELDDGSTLSATFDDDVPTEEGTEASDASTGAADDTDAEAEDDSDAAAEADDGDDDEDEGSGGIASKIRSILSS
ncbi:hypothetical protein [Haloarchaeobius salinus]|uniref:hypothetical protein n=1 Tax=Haloarchaeobius salinus TaxID=1198298 RepID=UPI00210BFA63|nr:hypothetical protein [Haloarchaeobius salinus]